MKLQIKYIASALVAAGLPIASVAQDVQRIEVRTSTEAIRHEGNVGFIGGAPFEAQFMGMEYVMSFGGNPVKGAPYSAEEVTETTQLLADGNRIHRQTSALVYRDREGRTRRDHTMNAIGPYATSGEQKNIIINDPTAGVNYILDPQARIARKNTIRLTANALEDAAKAKLMAEKAFARMKMETLPPPGAASVEYQAKVQAEAQSKEDLGTQTIGGVVAQGTRTTITIAAGQVGNDLPIKIVSERWFSPELGVVVMSKRSDPRFGDTAYHLANISRADPDPSLFQPPPDFTVQEGARAVEKMMLRK